MIPVRLNTKRLATYSMVLSAMSTIFLMYKLGMDDGVREKSLTRTIKNIADDKVEGPYIGTEGTRAFPKVADTRLLYKTQEEILKFPRRADSTYNINVTRSDRMSLDREIIDSRPEVCKTINYGDLSLLPKASLVIPFHNEALSMLLRTVHSALFRAPDILLNEIILIDDSSTDQNVKENLEKYLKLLPKVRILRTPHRIGLIRARMMGFRAAIGPVVIFQDAHTECNVGWLEPLLAAIRDNPRIVIQPFIDGIDANSVAYSTPWSIYRGSFSWDLRYVWVRVPDYLQGDIRRYAKPYATPVLVGCSLALHKDYFEEMGLFDEDMKIWGGENLELSFRIWQCGGNVLTVPCSRVGHVFKPFSYGFDQGSRQAIIEKNLMRVAETWMDDYKKYFYASTRVYENKRVNFTTTDLASLDERMSIRKKFKCKPFDWYLENIVPEFEVPPMDSVFYGEIMQTQSNACFEVLEHDYVGLTFLCYPSKIIVRNIFRINRKRQLTWRDKCVRFYFPDPQLRIGKCVDDGSEAWSLDLQGHTYGRLKVTRIMESGKAKTWCIMQVTSRVNPYKGEQMPEVTPCSDDRTHRQFQVWEFSYKFDFNQVPV